MRTARKLALKREAMTELTTDELGDVAGGVTMPDCLSNVIEPCTPSVSNVIRPCPTASPACTLLSQIIDPCIP